METEKRYSGAMPKRYLEFGHDRKHSSQVFGNPVHNGRVPAGIFSIEGIRVNGEVVAFLDEELPDKVHQALRGGKQIARSKLPFDCTWFAVLMDDASLAERLATGHYKVVDESGDRPVDPSDTSQDHIVNIGRGYHDMEFRVVHSAVPAHTTEGAQYLHKLGDSGPLCLSGLKDAINIFHGSGAFPMISYRLEQL